MNFYIFQNQNFSKSQVAGLIENVKNEKYDFLIFQKNNFSKSQIARLIENVKIMFLFYFLQNKTFLNSKLSD